MGDTLPLPRSRCLENVAAIPPQSPFSDQGALWPPVSGSNSPTARPWPHQVLHLLGRSITRERTAEKDFVRRDVDPVRLRFPSAFMLRKADLQQRYRRGPGSRDSRLRASSDGGLSGPAADLLQDVAGRSRRDRRHRGLVVRVRGASMTQHDVRIEPSVRTLPAHLYPVLPSGQPRTSRVATSGLPRGCATGHRPLSPPSPTHGRWLTPVFGQCARVRPVLERPSWSSSRNTAHDT